MIHYDLLKFIKLLQLFAKLFGILEQFEELNTFILFEDITQSRNFCSVLLNET